MLKCVKEFRCQYFDIVMFGFLIKEIPQFSKSKDIKENTFKFSEQYQSSHEIRLSYMSYYFVLYLYTQCINIFNRNKSNIIRYLCVS